MFTRLTLDKHEGPQEFPHNVHQNSAKMITKIPLFLATIIFLPFKKDFTSIVFTYLHNFPTTFGTEIHSSSLLSQRVNLLPQGGSSGGTPGKVQIF